jgi:hypothetical protein
MSGNIKCEKCGSVYAYQGAPDAPVIADWIRNHPCAEAGDAS